MRHSQGVQKELMDSGFLSGDYTCDDDVIKREKRKMQKVLAERKRRQRIDICLEQLKSILLASSSLSSHSSKNFIKGGKSNLEIEKTDILELTLLYIKNLQSEIQTRKKAGYLACIEEIYKIKHQFENPDDWFKLLEHLQHKSLFNSYLCSSNNELQNLKYETFEVSKNCSLNNQTENQGKVYTNALFSSQQTFPSSSLQANEMFTSTPLGKIWTANISLFSNSTAHRRFPVEYLFNQSLTHEVSPIFKSCSNLPMSSIESNQSSLYNYNTSALTEPDFHLSQTDSIKIRKRWSKKIKFPKVWRPWM